MNLVFDEQGGLALQRFSMEDPGYFQTPICPICHQNISWCLDMITFTTGFNSTPFTATHAECVWTSEAFRRLAKKLKKKEKAEE